MYVYRRKSCHHFYWLFWLRSIIYNKLIYICNSSINSLYKTISPYSADVLLRRNWHYSISRVLALETLCDIPTPRPSNTFSVDQFLCRPVSVLITFFQHIQEVRDSVDQFLCRCVSVEQFLLRSLSIDSLF